jgi:ABC-2 type transport system permease protein
MSPLRTYALRLRWEFGSLARPMLVLAPLSVAFAVCLAIGLGLLIPDITTESARYLATGAPTMILLTVGVSVIPQEMARRRVSGAYEFMQTIPGSRVAHLAGLLTPHLVINVPSALLSVVVAAWYYDFDLAPTPMVLPAIMLVALTGAAIGNALGTASPNTVVTAVLAQITVFFIMLFSPINYPASQLPAWLASVHQFLPFERMAELVRNSLVGAPVPMADVMYVLLWALGSFVVSAVHGGRAR